MLQAYYFQVSDYLLTLVGMFVCFVCWHGSVKAESERKPVNERTLLDNASNVLTNLLSGGNMGTMPIAEGAVSDLFGRPLFFALYDWFIQVNLLCTPCTLSRIML